MQVSFAFVLALRTRKLTSSAFSFLQPSLSSDRRRMIECQHERKENMQLSVVIKKTGLSEEEILEAFHRLLFSFFWPLCFGLSGITPC